jgi:hypothetical protein
MSPYAIVNSHAPSADAASLVERLTAWHDRMVSHERQLKTSAARDLCDDECPHVEAGLLWSEVTSVMADRAHELAFLRSRAEGVSP